MRSTLALLAVASLLAVSVPASGTAQPDCIPCEPVDNVCRKVLHVSCLAQDEAPQDRCVGTVCDAINAVCGGCLPATDAPAAVALAPSADPRCMGPVCEAINAVCWIALKTWCVG